MLLWEKTCLVSWQLCATFLCYWGVYLQTLLVASPTLQRWDFKFPCPPLPHHSQLLEFLIPYEIGTAHLWFIFF